MINNKKITAMIPARIGSTRLKKKNLALINNEPLISYCIKSAIKSKIFDNIVINSDSNIFNKIAKQHDIEFYLRPKKLGGSRIKSDDVVYDFMNKYESDITVWVNPISPLQESNEIRKVIKYFIKQNYNSLMTTNKKQVHAFYNNKSLNFKTNSKFAQTQHLKPIDLMVYSLMMWQNKSYISSMKKNKHAFLHGKLGYYNVSNLSGIIVKNIEDLKLVEMIINSKKIKSKIKYYK